MLEDGQVISVGTHRIPLIVTESLMWKVVLFRVVIMWVVFSVIMLA